MVRSQEKIDTINATHLKSIRLACLMEMKADAGSHLQEEQNDGNEFDEEEDMGELLKFPPNTDAHKLSIEQVMKSANVQNEKLLKVPSFVNEYTNKNIASAEFIFEHADKLLQQVPVASREFDLLPEQRIAIIAAATPVPKELKTELTISRASMEAITASGCRKQPFNARYYLKEGRMPMFSVFDYPPGSGKTVMALMSALIILVNTDKWKTLKREFQGTLESRNCEQFSGLVRGDDIQSMKLARLCIVYVPSTVLAHWYKTAQSAIYGIREVYGQHLDIILWRGRSTFQSIESAYETGKPVLWIMPMEASSLDIETKTPHIAYAVRILDELNARMQKKFKTATSPPLTTFITQATRDTLSTCTHGMPQHPIRLAFGGNFLSSVKLYSYLRSGNYQLVDATLDHLCKIRHFAAPDFLRRLVSTGICRRMPKGLNLFRMHLRVGTIANIVTGSVMDLSFPDLIGHMLSGASGAWKERIKDIFNTAVVLDSSTVLAEIDSVVEEMQPQNMVDNRAKMDILRLKTRLTEIFDGTLPLDPVTLEPICRKNLRLLRCCTAVIDVNTIPKIRSGLCPLCRSPLQAAEVEGDKTKLSASSSNASDKRAAPERDDDDDDDGKQEPAPPPKDPVKVFNHIVRDISSQNLYAVEAIMQLLLKQCELDSSSRILLCFGFDRHKRHLVNSLMARIRREIQLSTVTDVDIIAKDYTKAEDVISKYSNRTRYTNAQILVLNTEKNSSSIQGLDLFETDLTVIADQCSLATQRQAVGRCLRMQKLKQGQRIAAKHVVVLTMESYIPGQYNSEEQEDATGVAPASEGASSSNT
jgi:hypothetical protein